MGRPFLNAQQLLLICLLAGLAWILPGRGLAATQERPDEELREILIDAINSSDSFEDRFDAEVWLTDMSQRLRSRVRNPQERLVILKTVHYEARRAALEPELILALINVESNFDRFAISSAGAQGLMQICLLYTSPSPRDRSRDRV